MQFITTSGPPRERGRQHGEQLRDQVHEARTEWAGEARFDGTAQHLLDHLAGECPEVVEEMQGIAEGSGLGLDDVFLISCQATLGHIRQSQGCTTFVAQGVDGRCVMGKTQDVGDVEDRLQLVNAYQGADGRRGVVVGLAGAVWAVCGLNDRGLAVGINSAPRLVTPQSGRGLPQHLAAYPLLLRCGSVQEALDWWLPRPLAGKGICGCLCDAGGEAVTFERVAERFAICRASGSVFHVNHFRDPGLRAAEQRPGSANSLLREAHLGQRLAGRVFADPWAEADAVLRVTNRDEPGGICRLPSENQSATHSAYLADPSQRAFMACDGPPVSGSWRRYELG